MLFWWGGKGRQNDPFFEAILIILIFALPAFVLPLIIGPIIPRFFRDVALSRFAGWLTKKPLVATPLWAMFMLSWR